MSFVPDPNPLSPPLEFFCRLDVELAPIKEMGHGRAGQRRIIPIVGGRVTGPKVSGKILNLGADWQTIFADGVAELDTRYAFETDDGALIDVINYGYRHGPKQVIEALSLGHDVSADSYYMRTHARLETGDARYAWINKTLFIGSGQRQKSKVIVDLFALV